MNYSVATLADRWQCSRQHVYGMINRGELRAFKLGAKLFRIPAEEVEKCEALLRSLTVVRLRFTATVFFTKRPVTALRKRYFFADFFTSFSFLSG